MLARWSILAVTLAILAGTLLSIAPIRAFDQLERGSCPVHAEQDRHRFWMEELRAPERLSLAHQQRRPHVVPLRHGAHCETQLDVFRQDCACCP
jgi:hypothetical protein